MVLRFRARRDGVVDIYPVKRGLPRWCCGTNLLGNPLLQIHHGEGMTCVLNPRSAACPLRGTVDDPMVTPDTDDCRPHCLCLARTDRDIEHHRQQVIELEEVVAAPLCPPIRHAREQHELDRLKAIIDAHEQEAQDQ
ncbi:hypothetical protein ACFVT1_34205 [Streptomyces sp. NPDC057963]|uniref:hypothetical protein n=1 Tax=Streptomyces sp. NPDC057963 TaxID=3346290 RepID=UPI0036EC0711